MSLQRYSNTPNDGAEIRGQLSRVFRDSSDGDVFTLDDLVDRLHAERPDLVSYWLGDLADHNQIDQYFLVVSPNGRGGIQKYERFTDIPPEIYDPYQLKEINIQPWYIVVYFTKHREATHDTSR
jgi:hypothetical protein